MNFGAFKGLWFHCILFGQKEDKNPTKAFEKYAF